MCGIVGFIYRDTNQSRDELLDSCLSMTEQIKRRGPDAVGVWVDEASQLALGHRFIIQWCSAYGFTEWEFCNILQWGSL